MPDLLFDNILDELQEIHDSYPDLSFPAVVQQAIDESKRSKNKNLNDVSSKEMLSALQQFNGKSASVRINTPLGKEARLQRALNNAKKGVGN